MKRPVTYLIRAVFVLLLTVNAHPIRADGLPEYTVKAAYLYNFSMLTEWPLADDSAGIFKLCVYGRDDFGPALETLRGRTVNDLKILVFHIDEPEQASQCQLVFIGGGVDRYHAGRLFNTIADLPVLTVTDDNGLAQAGVMILLKPEKQRLVFEINVGKARQASLGISSKLLRLARRVETQ